MEVRGPRERARFLLRARDDGVGESEPHLLGVVVAHREPSPPLRPLQPPRKLRRLARGVHVRVVRGEVRADDDVAVEDDPRAVQRLEHHRVDVPDVARDEEIRLEDEHLLVAAVLFLFVFVFAREVRAHARVARLRTRQRRALHRRRLTRHLERPPPEPRGLERRFHREAAQGERASVARRRDLADGFGPHPDAQELSRRAQRLERVAVHEHALDRRRLLSREVRDQIVQALDRDVVRGVHRDARLVPVPRREREDVVRELGSVREQHRLVRAVQARHLRVHHLRARGGPERELRDARGVVRRAPGAAVLLDDESPARGDSDVVERTVGCGRSPTVASAVSVAPTTTTRVDGDARRGGEAVREREQREVRVAEPLEGLPPRAQAEIARDDVRDLAALGLGAAPVRREGFAKETHRVENHRLFPVREHGVHHALLQVRVRVGPVLGLVHHRPEVEARRERFHVHVEPEDHVPHHLALARRHRRRRLRRLPVRRRRPLRRRLSERLRHPLRVRHSGQERLDLGRVFRRRHPNVEIGERPRAVRREERLVRVGGLGGQARHRELRQRELGRGERNGDDAEILVRETRERLVQKLGALRPDLGGENQARHSKRVRAGGFLLRRPFVVQPEVVVRRRVVIARQTRAGALVQRLQSHQPHEPTGIRVLRHQDALARGVREGVVHEPRDGVLLRQVPSRPTLLRLGGGTGSTGRVVVAAHRDARECPAGRRGVRRDGGDERDQIVVVLDLRRAHAETRRDVRARRLVQRVAFHL